ncbi:hypothetical protein F5Y15DRAFT_128864 [Xylariaceae sp. FL0016]|nr:hypothetical protein F5Y15DRAFT_128864 [Xylariaceae sp. FL0016]
MSQRLLDNMPFPFERLPNDIQFRIWKMLFVKYDLVHCLSRLDPYHVPLDFPEEDVEGQSQLPTGFHFGSSPCTISLAKKPAAILGYFLVCKRWYFVGTHAFYGVNTFAFSSLGEFGRFSRGIGPRLARIANVEIMWHGSLLPAHQTRINQRTLPLTKLMDMPRLRTLVVHIEESNIRRMRRKYEIQDREHLGADFADETEWGEERLHYPTLGPMPLMCERTDLHPNYRRNRSMRTVHGMDYVYQLRGMDWVRFQELNSEEWRKSIRDHSFLEDVSRQVRMPKAPRHHMLSQLENLPTLTGMGTWEPSDEDFELIKRFYDTSMPQDGGYASDSEDKWDSDSNTAVEPPSDESDREIPDSDDDDDAGESDDDDGSDDDGGDEDIEDLGSDVQMFEDLDHAPVDESENDDAMSIDNHDDTVQPSISGSRSPSNSCSNMSCYDTGLQTTVTPGLQRMPTIDLTGDDSDDEVAIKDHTPSTEGIFVCSGSGSDNEVLMTDAAQDSESEVEMTAKPIKREAEAETETKFEVLIDLTADSDDEGSTLQTPAPAVKPSPSRQRTAAPSLAPSDASSGLFIPEGPSGTPAREDEEEVHKMLAPIFRQRTTALSVAPSDASSDLFVPEGPSGTPARDSVKRSLAGGSDDDDSSFSHKKPRI